jgi:hypothetical protein
MALKLATDFENGSLIESVSGAPFTISGTPVFKRSTKGIGLFTKAGSLRVPNFIFSPTNKISIEITTNVNFVDLISQVFMEAVNSYSAPHFVVYRSSAGNGKLLFVTYYNGVTQTAFTVSNFFTYSGDYHITVTLDFSLTSEVCKVYRNGVLFYTSTSGIPQFPNLTYTNLSLFGGSGSNKYTNYGIKYYDHVLSQKDVENLYYDFTLRKGKELPVKNYLVPKETLINDTGLIAEYNFKNIINKVLINEAPSNPANNYNPVLNNISVSQGWVKTKNGARISSTSTILNTNYTIGTSDFSILSRVNLKSDLATDVALFGPVSNNTSFWIMCTTSGTLTVRLYDGITIVNATTTIDIKRKFISLAVCIDRDSFIKIYVDGILLLNYTALTASGNITYKIGIGARSTNAVLAVGAEYQNAKIYNRVVTESEVKDYHNSFVTTPIFSDDFSNYPANKKIRSEWITKSGNFTVKEILPMKDLNLQNGGFDSSIGWTLYNGTTIAGGVISINMGAGNTAFRQNLPNLVMGQKYRITYTILNYVSGTGKIYVGDTASSQTAGYSANGTYTVDITASGTVYDMFGYATGGANQYDMDNISIIPIREKPTGMKYLNCVNSGSIAISSQQAYGTWEWDFYKGDSVNDTFFTFIANEITSHVTNTSILSNGYYFRLVNTERVDFGISTGSTNTFLAYSATPFINNNTWYRIRITRNINGLFSLYIIGGSILEWTLLSTVGGGGSNPISNTTYTRSKYFCAVLDPLDAIANIKIYPGIKV